MNANASKIGLQYGFVIADVGEISMSDEFSFVEYIDLFAEFLNDVHIVFNDQYCGA